MSVLFDPTCSSCPYLPICVNVKRLPVQHGSPEHMVTSNDQDIVHYR